jgi:hypothetical protein
LTPDDIAEVIVFAAGRRENVVLADSLIFPNHQVGLISLSFKYMETDQSRLLPLSCTRSNRYADGMVGWNWVSDV